MAYYLYMLLCSDNSLYTGTTNDIAKRMATHAAGKGSKYVRSRLPFTHVYTEEFADAKAALAREREIKKLLPAQKRALLA